MGESAANQVPLPAPAAAARVVRSKRRRVLIEDARGDGSYLRVTWHPEGGKTGQVFVVSTWREEVCTGAIRVPVAASADLAGLVLDGLRDAATNPPAPVRPAGPWDAILTTLRAWVGRGKAQVTALSGRQRWEPKR